MFSDSLSRRCRLLREAHMQVIRGAAKVMFCFLRSALSHSQIFCRLHMHQRQLLRCCTASDKVTGKQKYEGEVNSLALLITNILFDKIQRRQAVHYFLYHGHVFGPGIQQR